MYSFDTRVRYSELKEDRMVSLVSIINYFQDCCSFESEDGDVGLDWMAEHHTAWMLTNWQIKVIRRPVYGENIRVKTWPTFFKYFLGKRNFVIENAKTGEKLVCADSDWAYVNVLSGRPERNVPEKELEVYQLSEPLEGDFVKGKIQVPDEMEELAPLTIGHTSIDTNHHVNNAQYIALAMAQLPQGVKGVNFRSLRAEYKQQSLLGDALYPKRAFNDGVYVITLDDAEGNHKLISEFC